jgi:hypothetical protein
MQQFHKFITWCLCVVQHVSCDSPLIRRVAIGALLVVVCQTTTNNAPAASLQRQNQRLLVQLYAPDDARGDGQNMLSHT